MRPTREFQVFRLTSDLHETTYRATHGVRTTKEGEPVSNRVGLHIRNSVIRRQALAQVFRLLLTLISFFFFLE